MLIVRAGHPQRHGEFSGTIGQLADGNIPAAAQHDREPSSREHRANQYGSADTGRGTHQVGAPVYAV